MAESTLKRQREGKQIDELVEVEETKRHKPSSYNHILSLLDEADEEEPAQDLSSLMTSLQHELSSHDSIPCPNTNDDQESSDPIISFSSSSSSHSSNQEDEVDDKEGVMRHLLEASDDELGIPSMEASGANNSSTDSDEVGISSADCLALCDGLWDLEDEAANYYTLLQSQLFM